MRSSDVHEVGWIARTWCRVRGHKWLPVFPPTTRSQCLVCRRCRENAWRLS